MDSYLDDGLLNELVSVTKKYNLGKKDFCVVGSTCLSLAGIRNNRDIDIIIRSAIRSRIFSNSHKAFMLSNNVELVGENWARLIGLSDNELIDNSKYHIVVDGFKIARLEIAFSVKNCTRRNKDIKDIGLIEQYALKSTEWNWDIVLDCISTLEFIKRVQLQENGEKSSKKYAHIASSFLRRVRKTFINLCLRPRKTLHIIYTLCKHILHSFKPKSQIARLVENELLIKYPTHKLLAKQQKGNQFNRMDVVVRYLAVEEYFNRNNIGFSLYRKMQKNRVNWDTEEDFRSLIHSFNEKGFDVYSPIEVDIKLNLQDGSHRLALALYFRIDEVPLRIQSNSFDVDYNINWFKDNNFSDSEIKLLQSKQIEIFMNWGIYFPVILWPTVQANFEEIEKDIRNRFQIHSCQEYFIPDDDFPDFVRRIYATDDIEKWKIERKIYAISPYPKRVYVIFINLYDPQFRKKAQNNHDISTVVEKLKVKYRSIYANKVNNYIYDIVIHTGDNFEQNQKILAILNDYGNFIVHKSCIPVFPEQTIV